jgi:hypothetical protein
MNGDVSLRAQSVAVPLGGVVGGDDVASALLGAWLEPVGCAELPLADAVVPTLEAVCTGPWLALRVAVADVLLLVPQPVAIARTTATLAAARPGGRRRIIACPSMCAALRRRIEVWCGRVPKH